MRRFLCLAFLLSCAFRLQALEREAFTFTKYNLTVRIEPEQQRLGVRGQITLRNDSGSSQRSLSLQISSSLNWVSITFGGKPVEFLTQTYTSDIDHTGALSEAIVVLPQPVAPKQSIDLNIGYEGVIPQDITRLTRIGVPADTAKHTDWDGIGKTFTAVRGIGYVAWYPVATDAAILSEGDAVPDAVARWHRGEAATEMKAAFTYSGSGNPPKLLCNGSQTPISYESMEAGYEGNSQCTFLFGKEDPLFVLGDFSTLDRPALSIQYLAEHKNGADDYSSAVDEVTPLITKWFGDHREGTETRPEVVDSPDSQAAVYQSGNMLLMPLSGSDTKLLLTAAQQLAHVFFSSRESWIRDGLASYAQVRLIEEKEGRQAAIAYLQAHRTRLVDAEKQVSDKSKADEDALVNAGDAFRIQVKAMYIWSMLRDMLGDEAFAIALHNYRAADDRDLTYSQKLLEAQAHRDLQWFFDDWVYHDRGLPDFRIASVYSSQLPSGGYLNTVTVENLGSAGAEVRITLHLKTREATQRLMVPAKSKASVRIETGSLPQSATVNDGSVPESDASNNEYKLNH